MKLTSRQLQLHVDTLRIIERGHRLTNPADYLESARAVLIKLHSCDEALLERIEAGGEPVLSELASNVMFERHGWITKGGISAAASAKIEFTDLWDRVSAGVDPAP